MSAAPLTIRRALDADLPAVIGVCQASLGWRPDDPNAEFFDWKHHRNSFGTSPMWVAEDEDEIIGVRVFMRWRFRDGNGEVISAVRAVDTATSPKAQGRGVFTALTLGAIPDLRDDGVDVIFNTPNDKSRPGYLKMGWNEVGRVPVAVGIDDVRSIPSILGANTAAEMWSEPTSYGSSAAEVFADLDAGAQVLSKVPTTPAFATARDPEYLRWRYSFAPLHYRLHPLGDSLRDGAVVFRTRRRGTALEVAAVEVLAPSERGVASAFRAILKGTGADYVMSTQGPGSWRRLSLPVPRLGPRLTWRTVSRPGTPKMSDLQLSLGDVELF